MDFDPIKAALDYAARAIREGNLNEGEAALRWVLTQDGDNVLALLWMTKCVQEDHVRLAYFSRVLEIDPANAHALKGVEIYARKPSKGESSNPLFSTPSHFRGQESLDPALAVNRSPPTASQVSNRSPHPALAPATPIPQSIALGIGVLGFLFLLSVALLVWASNRGSPTPSSPSEHLLDTTYEEGETRFGYTESERRQIWEEIIRAEDRADVEAIQIYPDMSPYDEWRGLFDELAFTYKSELAQKLGLSYEQLGEIGFEAIEKDWPFPPLP
jgi:hypothetical protein